MGNKSFNTLFPASYRPYVPPPPSGEHMPVESRKPVPYIADGYYKGDSPGHATMSNKSSKTLFPAGYRPYVPPPPSGEHMPVEPRKPVPYIADGYYQGDSPGHPTVFSHLWGFIIATFRVFAGVLVDILNVLYAVAKTAWKLFASVMIILWKILLIMTLFDFLAGE
jgi:hypothetical protein